MDNEKIQVGSAQELEELKPVQEPEQSSESLAKRIKRLIRISPRTAIIILIIIVVGVLGYIYKGLFVAATVNGSPISRLAVVQRLERVNGSSTLDNLIAEKLIRDEAKAKGISVSNDEVNTEVKKAQDQIASQGGTLDEALKAQSMTMNDLKNQIVLQKDLEKMLIYKIISVSRFAKTRSERQKFLTNTARSMPINLILSAGF